MGSLPSLQPPTRLVVARHDHLSPRPCCRYVQERTFAFSDLLPRCFVVGPGEDLPQRNGSLAYAGNNDPQVEAVKRQEATRFTVSSARVPELQYTNCCRGVDHRDAARRGPDLLGSCSVGGMLPRGVPFSEVELTRYDEHFFTSLHFGEFSCVIKRIVHDIRVLSKTSLFAATRPLHFCLGLVRALKQSEEVGALSEAQLLGRPDQIPKQGLMGSFWCVPTPRFRRGAERDIKDFPFYVDL